MEWEEIDGNILFCALEILKFRRIAHGYGCSVVFGKFSWIFFDRETGFSPKLIEVLENVDVYLFLKKLDLDLFFS